MTEKLERPEQGEDLIFALDIGTRSIIGMVGRAVKERFQVLAVEKEEHSKRAMIDGQIEDVGQVAQVVLSVTGRLEEKLGCSLRRVCIAAAGRALHTERGHFELTLPGVRRIDSDLIGQLEAGAVSDAESALARSGQEEGRVYLVGYTVSQYRLDHYPLTTLRDHNGRVLEAEVVATFLPAEVVESLYSAMNMAQLEVESLTLEPIAALNAAIPADLRLLNLVLADVGAGTSDIAVCRDGSVVGYTMATVAGDEITECIMKALLVDFHTAELLKAGMSGREQQAFTDILGMEQRISPEELKELTAPAARELAEELSRRVQEVNGGPPSALFLAGGGSKLSGLRELVAETLGIEPRRVAVAGNNFQISAFSEVCSLNDPEYSTPLGIAVSAGLGLISDSYRITLNGHPAKLFRSGTLTALDVLMMNGYGYADLIGRTGKSLAITVDGERVFFRGEPATPSVLRINGKEAPPSTLIQTGDQISFTPASPGNPVKKTLEEVLGSCTAATAALLNGEAASGDRLLKSGDKILTGAESVPEPVSIPQFPPIERIEVRKEKGPSGEVEPQPSPPALTERLFFLNGVPLALPIKEDGAPYYLMDLLVHSGIDFAHLNCRVLLEVNGEDGQFTQELKDGDAVTIRCTEET